MYITIQNSLSDPSAINVTTPQSYIAGRYSTVCMGRKEFVVQCVIQKLRQQGRLNGEEALQKQREKHYRGSSTVVHSKVDCLKAPW